MGTSDTRSGSSRSAGSSGAATSQQELEALLESIAALDKIKEIDLDKVVEEREKKKPQRTKYAEAMERGELARAVRKKARKAPKRKRGRPKKSKAHHKKWRKEYYRQVLGPKRWKRLADDLREHGWYTRISESWGLRKREAEFLITREEFDTWISPVIPDTSIPILSRYNRFDTEVRLDNCLVRDQDTGEVWFDGMEHRMRELGLII